uniref:Uncharacterized protein n=1 Tax=Arundo donax TaxID=35708 RepID=A0A0A9BNT7_ARUDO
MHHLYRQPCFDVEFIYASDEAFVQFFHYKDWSHFVANSVNRCITNA